MSGRRGLGVRADDLLDRCSRRARRGGAQAQSGDGRGAVRRDRAADRRRRPALLHAALLAQSRRGVRPRRRAGVRGRDRTLPAVLGGPRAEHPGQGRGTLRGRGGRSARRWRRRIDLAALAPDTLADHWNLASHAAAHRRGHPPGGRVARAVDGGQARLRAGADLQLLLPPLPRGPGRATARCGRTGPRWCGCTTTGWSTCWS